jgi:hypothetical protein
MYSSSSVATVLSNPWLLNAGQPIFLSVQFRNETGTAVELLPWHAVMLQFRSQGSQGLAAELVQGFARSGLSHRSSSFTLAYAVTTAGLYSLKTVVVECSTVLVEYSYSSDETKAMASAQLPVAVRGRLVDVQVKDVIPPLHWPLNVSVNVFLIVPNDRDNLIVRASFNQPFSLFVNSNKVWQCRSIECDSGDIELGKFSAGDVVLLRLAVARVLTSSAFSLFWNAENHPIVIEPIVSQHTCSSQVHDVNGGSTLVSVAGTTLQAAATKLFWHSSVVSKYCSGTSSSDQELPSSPLLAMPDTFHPDASACTPRVSSGSLLSFAAFFKDSYQNFISPDFENLAIFLVSDECDIEASISSRGVESAAAGVHSFFSFRAIRSTFEKPAYIQLRMLTPGLIATYYRDSAAHSTSTASTIDWSSSGSFPGDASVQIWRVKWKGFLKSPTGAWTLTVAKPASSADTVRVQIGRFDINLGASNSWSHLFSLSHSVHYAVAIHYTHFAGSSSSGLTVSWKLEGTPSPAAIPSSAFFSDTWSFTSDLKVLVSPGASWSCEVISPTISLATAGLPSIFVVSATDAFQNAVTELSHMSVLLSQLSGCDTLLDSSCAQISRIMHKDGVQVTLTIPGLYQLQVIDSGRSSAACTSFSQFYVHPGHALLANSLVSLFSASISTAGLPLYFNITSRDQFANAAPLLASYAYFSLTITCIGPSPCCDSCVASRSSCSSSILCYQAKSSSIVLQGVVASVDGHRLSVAFIPTQSGVFRLQILPSKECSFCDNLPSNSTWDVTVKPSVHSAANLDTEFTEIFVIAGDSVTVSGRSFDVFGNVVLAPDPPTQVECVVRLNRRIISGFSSYAFLSSNFHLTCAVKVTAAGTFELSMISLQSKFHKLNCSSIIHTNNHSMQETDYWGHTTAARLWRLPWPRGWLHPSTFRGRRFRPSL